MTKAISVVIPLAPGETVWRELVGHLDLPDGSEIILSVGKQDVSTEDAMVKIVQGPAGRAQQMNTGAQVAENEVLWFLHADSRLGDAAIERLFAKLGQNPNALWFFDLRFADDGPAAMKWNELAVRWRAGVLKIPFGDQGFCISKELFFKLGGYREDLAYGEDHVFVWKVRQEGYPVERVRAELFTSARKYEKGGWLATTWAHVWRTIWQAAPQLIELMRRRFLRQFS